MRTFLTSEIWCLSTFLAGGNIGRPSSLGMSISCLGDGAITVEDNDVDVPGFVLTTGSSTSPSIKV